MATPNSAAVFQDPIFDETFDPKSPRTWVFTWELIQYFLQRQTQIDTSPQALRRVSLTNQQASIALKPIPLPSLAAGLYRITSFLHVTQAADTSSHATLSIGFTASGATCSVSGAVMNGNTVTTVQTNTWLLKIDGATALTYQIDYASAAVTPMTFDLELLVESITAP